MCNRLEVEYNARVAEARAAEPSRVAPVVESPEFDPTPQRVVEAMLGVAAPAKGEVLYDLGCGDGRVLTAAVQEFGCKAVGIEIDPRIAEIARENVEKLELKGIRIVEGDVRKFKLTEADVIFIYQLPELVAELTDAMVESPRVVVSYNHPLPGVSNEEYEVDGEHKFYVWRRPLSAAWW